MPGMLGIVASSERGTAKRSNDIVDLYDTLRPSLLAYLSGLGLGKNEAEDVVQESFLRLLSNLSEEQNEHQLRAWIFRVAHNISIDYFRSAAPQAKMAVRKNAQRIVAGACHLSPSLGERMRAAKLGGKDLVMKELMRQDLKFELDQLTEKQAGGAARYLAGVVGKAHGRQIVRNRSIAF